MSTSYAFVSRAAMAGVASKAHIYNSNHFSSRAVSIYTTANNTTDMTSYYAQFNNSF